LAALRDWLTRWNRLGREWTLLRTRPKTILGFHFSAKDETACPRLMTFSISWREKAMVDRAKLVPEAKLSDLNISSLDMVEIVFPRSRQEWHRDALTPTPNAQRVSRTLGDVIAVVKNKPTRRPRAASSRNEPKPSHCDHRHGRGSAPSGWT